MNLKYTALWVAHLFIQKKKKKLIKDYKNFICKLFEIFITIYYLNEFKIYGFTSHSFTYSNKQTADKQTEQTKQIIY